MVKEGAVLTRHLEGHFTLRLPQVARSGAFWPWFACFWQGFLSTSRAAGCPAAGCFGPSHVRRQGGGQPCRSGALVAGTLELFAALVGLMVFVPRENRSGASWGSVAFRAGTENQRNTWLKHKLATTKFPLCLALAEMAEQMRIRDLAMALGRS